MLRIAIACLVIVLMLAVRGFGGIAAAFIGVAKILIVFLLLSVVSFFGCGIREDAI